MVAEIAAFRIDDRFVPAPEALFMDSPRSFFCGVLLRFAHLLDVFSRCSSLPELSFGRALSTENLYCIICRVFTCILCTGSTVRPFVLRKICRGCPGDRLTERLSISNLQIKYPSCLPNGRVFYYSPFWSNRSSVSLFYTHYIVEPGSMQ